MFARFSKTAVCVRSQLQVRRKISVLRGSFFSGGVRRFSSEAERDVMEYDVLIVGAGPAGLSAAIRLKQLAAKQDREVNVCIIEKGAEVGSHILSGNVFNPKALTELIPDWREKGAPLEQGVHSDTLHYLTESNAIPLPIPPSLHNEGNYIISLGNLVRWLSEQAEELGVDIYPGFAASEVLYDNDGGVAGVATADVGIGKDGNMKDTFERGVELRAKQTMLAEGCRGSLSQQVMETFDLRKECDPQTYGLGLKEVWEVDEGDVNFKAGTVQHTIGWPVKDTQTWQGTFLYHMAPNKILLGMVVGLDYANPHLSPYHEFQQFKTHPHIRKYLENARCISYGARALNEGGLQAVPKLTFKGGMLVGCSAGFLNVAAIKGSHTAMKTGMLAADAVFEQIDSLEGAEISAYETKYKDSWVYKELYEVRNLHPSFQKFGMYGFMLYSALDTFILKGNVNFTFQNHVEDVDKTMQAHQFEPIDYPKPDNKLTFDILTNLQRSGTYHDDDQPSHLKIKEGHENTPLMTSYHLYAAPESRFCPAKVYEYTEATVDSPPKLVINAQNCLHCKTCDIKTPGNYIKWCVPEGGGGPSYESM